MNYARRKGYIYVLSCWDINCILIILVEEPQTEDPLSDSMVTILCSQRVDMLSSRHRDAVIHVFLYHARSVFGRMYDFIMRTSI